MTGTHLIQYHWEKDERSAESHYHLEAPHVSEWVDGFTWSLQIQQQKISKILLHVHHRNVGKSCPSVSQLPLVCKELNLDFSLGVQNK